MAGGAQNNDDDLITQINVTPLVDVILVLLIILMVTASYIASRSIPMELPQGATGEQQQLPRSLSVSIDHTGHLYIDAEAIEDDAFRPAIRRYRTALANPEADARAVIAADGRVSHSRFVQVLDILRDEQVSRFAINVRPEDLQQ